MCIIVDTNRASSFADAECKNGSALREWLMRKQEVLVIGGKLTEELSNSSASNFIRELERIGLIDSVPDSELEVHMPQAGTYESDDPHIIGLIRARRVSVVYSDDQNLGKDLKKFRNLRGDRPKLYKYVAHRKMLEHCSCKAR